MAVCHSGALPEAIVARVCVTDLRLARSCRQCFWADRWCIWTKFARLMACTTSGSRHVEGRFADCFFGRAKYPIFSPEDLTTVKFRIYSRQSDLFFG